MDTICGPQVFGWQQCESYPRWFTVFWGVLVLLGVISLIYQSRHQVDE